MNELAQSTTNPALGLFIFSLGGLAGAVVYLPFKNVKHWAWESYWLIYALFGLIIVPWVLAVFVSPNTIAVLQSAPRQQLIYCCLCGAAWGVGGLTWGLMIRYLGVGLGLAIGCGLTSASGTIVPMILKGQLSQLFEPGAGIWSLIGVLVSLLGIVLIGMAGMLKERELSDEKKKEAVAEFDFKKGIMAAVFSGLMSSAMNYGLQGGPDIQQLAQITAPVTSLTWSGIPVLVVVLFGGFVVNFAWCLYLNFKNKTTGDYFKAATPLTANLIFAGLAGAIWCAQFICFKTAEPEMGRTAYVGWAVLMASQILFATLIGVMLGEWKGTGNRTKAVLVAGFILLVLTSVISGYSSKLSQSAPTTSVISSSISPNG